MATNESGRRAGEAIRRTPLAGRRVVTQVQLDEFFASAS